MATEQYENNKHKKRDDSDTAIKPDPETLHTTDPQEHMEGPFSSLMQGTKESFEDNGSEEEVKKIKEEE